MSWPASISPTGRPNEVSILTDDILGFFHHIGQATLLCRGGAGPSIPAKEWTIVPTTWAVGRND